LLTVTSVKTAVDIPVNGRVSDMLKSENALVTQQHIDLKSVLLYCVFVGG